MMEQGEDNSTSFSVVPDNKRLSSNVIYMLAPGNTREVYTPGDTGKEL